MSLRANYDLNVAKKALYPSLSVSGSVSAADSDIADIFDIESLAWERCWQFGSACS